MFLGHEDAPDEAQLFHVPLAEAEAVVQPHLMAADLGGKTMRFVTLGDGWRSHAFLPSLPHSAPFFLKL
jgi:hypothetical protein